MRYEQMKGKGNDGKGNTIERDSWETDNELFDVLDEQYRFLFDCCATGENKKCGLFSNDFLNYKNPYNDTSWMNPPFSKAKEMFEHFFKIIKKGVAIFRCDNMETKVWQEIILKNADWIFIPKGRFSYTCYDYKPDTRSGTRFPSALIGLGVEPPKELEGITLSTVKEKKQ
ncbi:DNA N-6-adenine-methyltransferase [Lutibacter sp.]|uniref:DNA N-6-adenine-methyltransferase n=1 Tax=Lutibacter sp. TaxID=1925666 RepID=UPI0034A020C9